MVTNRHLVLSIPLDQCYPVLHGIGVGVCESEHVQWSSYLMI